LAVARGELARDHDVLGAERVAQVEHSRALRMHRAFKWAPILLPIASAGKSQAHLRTGNALR
jgi:hypothetical protein